MGMNANGNISHGPQGQKGSVMDPTIAIMTWAFDLPFSADQCSAIYQTALDGWLAVQHETAAVRIEEHIRKLRAKYGH